MEALLERDRAEREAMRLRLEIQDECSRLPECDGTDAEIVQEYVRRAALVPENLRLAVLRKTAHGDLREELDVFTATDPLPTWEATRLFILQTFVSPDIVETTRSQLENLRQEHSESVLHFNRRFKRIAAEAYPEERRNSDTHRLLIKAYGRALKEERLARKMAADGWPATLNAAMERTARTETNDAIVRNLGRSTEQPMEIDAVRTDRPSLTQPSRDTQRLQTMIAKLEAKIDRLEATGTTHKGPGWKKETRACYGCGKVGHLLRFCPDKKHAPSGGPAAGRVAVEAVQGGTETVPLN